MKFILITILTLNLLAYSADNDTRFMRIYDDLAEVESRIEKLESTPTQIIPDEEPEIISDTKVDNTVNLNIAWVMIAGVLVMLMQIGFALVETGLTRKKNAVHTMTLNLMDYGFGMIAFWGVGFAIMFGGVGAIESLGIDASVLNKAFSLTLGQNDYSIMGFKGFFLGDQFLSSNVFVFFFFQMVFAATANTICTGTLAERWRIGAFCISSFLVTGLLYPLFGHWVWGGGWLSSVVGFQDFAGSVVVHGVGGIIALAGALVIGNRMGKYNKQNEAQPIPGHNLPYMFIGTFILAFGWFGFNAGSTLTVGGNLGLICVNTALASAAGSCVALLLTYFKFGQPDPTFACNGLLAGLVAVTAGCANISPWAAVLIGGIGGFLVVFSAIIIEERFKIDDPVGAISVHGVCGLWGGIALGIFANPVLGKAGLIYGDLDLFKSQIIGVIVCIGFIFPSAYLMFKFIGFVTSNRASDEEQSIGLDLSEMGIEAYPKDV